MRVPDPVAGAAGMAGLQNIGTAENYRCFARDEAAGRSPDYEALAYAVAEDKSVLSFLEQMPRQKRQPNLLFAAARLVLGAPPSPSSLHTLVVTRPDDLRETMHAKRTQTNEPARCAVLLPALAALPQPLALLEVGASAGLTLLPDLYSYDYDGCCVTGLAPLAPTLRCQAIGPVPLPAVVPEVAWRAGIDLNPLDINNADDVAWLECLIWPGEQDRAERLQAAVAIAKKQPPTIHQGDLLDELGAIADQAPPGATLVVYHSAVLAYVDDNKRRAFAQAVRELNAIWLSNEGSRVLQCIGIEGPGSTPSFVLVRNG